MLEVLQTQKYVIIGYYSVERLDANATIASIETIKSEAGTHLCIRDHE